MMIDTDGDGYEDTEITLADYYAQEYMNNFVNATPQKQRDYLRAQGLLDYPDISQDSVLALGMGPLSEEALASLVQSGDLISVEENDGLIHFYRPGAKKDDKENKVRKSMGFVTGGNPFTI